MTYDLDFTLADDDGQWRAWLDKVAAYGVVAEDGRAVATWLEGQVEELRHQLKAAKDQLADSHTDPGPQLMPYGFYHPNKQAAQEYAARLQAHEPLIRDVKVELEPYNGWVVVLMPHYADLSAYADRAEIRDDRKRPKPEGRKRPPPLPTAPDRARPSGAVGTGKGEPGSPPVRGVTAKVWEIAEKVTAEKGAIDRSAIIAACEAAGINPSTAATQYSKWKRSKGG